MKYSTVIAGIAVAAALGSAAPAVAAPAMSGNAAATIMQLEDQGYRVIVTRESMVPLDQASVVSITRGPAIRTGVPFSTSQGDNYRSVSSQTVYVTVK